MQNRYVVRMRWPPTDISFLDLSLLRSSLPLCQWQDMSTSLEEQFWAQFDPMTNIVNERNQCKIEKTYFLEVVNVQNGLVWLGSENESSLATCGFKHGSAMVPGVCLLERSKICCILDIMKKNVSRTWLGRVWCCRAQYQFLQAHGKQNCGFCKGWNKKKGHVTRLL